MAKVKQHNHHRATFARIAKLLARAEKLAYAAADVGYGDDVAVSWEAMDDAGSLGGALSNLLRDYSHRFPAEAL